MWRLFTIYSKSTGRRAMINQMIRRYKWGSPWLLKFRSLFFGGQALRKFSAARDVEFKAASPRIWDYIIYVSISIILIIVVAKFAFNLAPKKSKLVRTEKAAIKAYEQYTQKLDAISKKYSKEYNGKFR
jgi:hypothetical protein